MRKKLIGVIFAAAMVAGLAGYGSSSDTGTNTTAADTQAAEAQKEGAKDDAKKEGEEEDSEVSDTEGIDDPHIGIVTGSMSQSEGDRHGAEAFQAVYGEDMVRLAIYPDNFTEELETTAQIIINFPDDPKIKAIIMNQSVPGTTKAFHKIKETRPDILCIAGEGHEDLPETDSVADLVCNNDSVVRGYLIVCTTHELGCDTLVHISFPRHTAYGAMSRRMAVTKEAYEEFGMEFVLGTAPDPTSDVGVADARAYILEKVPEWIEKYGESTAYFCTNDVHTEPLLERLMEYGGYFIEADLPSSLTGYPGALDTDLTAEVGDFDKIPTRAKSTIVEKGGADHFGIWAYPYGYTTSAGPAQHVLNVLNGESEPDDIDDIVKACQAFFPKAEWNGPSYTNAETSVKLGGVSLVYQDTYTMGDPGHFMGSTEIEAPEKYSTTK